MGPRCLLCSPFVLTLLLAPAAHAEGTMVSQAGPEVPPPPPVTYGATQAPAGSAQPAPQTAPQPATQGAPQDNRPFTTPLPQTAPEPRVYGYTEAEGAGGRPATMRQAWNAVFAEAMGSAGLYSINYDRMLTEILSVRLGFSYMSGNFFDKNVGVFTAPLMVNFLFGTVNHKFELGAGPVLSITESGKQSLPPFDGAPAGGSFNLGYRFTPPGGGVMVRVGFSPIFGAGGFWPWGGVSVGAAF